RTRSRIQVHSLLAGEALEVLSTNVEPWQRSYHPDPPPSGSRRRRGEDGLLGVGAARTRPTSGRRAMRVSCMLEDLDGGTITLTLRGCSIIFRALRGHVCPISS